jgi:formate-dependent nitrite reductase cytochrome c552 subunit
MVDELTAIFVKEGLLKEDGTWNASAAAPLTVTEEVANAMWNYNFVVEDNSMGVHNSAFAKALLQQALDVMKK